MTWLIVLLAAGAMLALAIVMGFILGWANKAFHVEVNPLVERALDMLPGANCGGCGYMGCADFAEAVVEGKAPPTACPVGGEGCATKLARLLGIELDESAPYRPVVHCGATYEDRLGRTDYQGEPTCEAANFVAGVQGCAYGCLGFGDCQAACPFDAIHVVDGLAVVNYDKCTGCGKCEKVCPRHIISMAPFKAEQMLVVKCSNKDFGKDVRAVCKVGCIGCKACARISDLFVMKDNLPHIDYDKYEPGEEHDLNLVLDKCPMKRMQYVGKPSEKDLAAVADEKAPAIVEADFKTTVDDAEYRG